MPTHALRPRLLLAAAALTPLVAAYPARANPVAYPVRANPAGSPARAIVESWPASQDVLLSEIQKHFHATRKWFGMVSDLQHDRAADGTLTPRFETLQKYPSFVLRQDAAGQTLRAHLPADASAAHVVEFDGVEGFSVRTKEVGILPVPAEVHQGVVAYRGAVAGGDVLYKLTPTHVDEYIYLREPQAHLHREFEFDTGPAVWILREADTMIEALGKDGVARLRLSAPLARAADGKRRRGTAHIVGRTIVLDIDLSGLAAPILVDPDWSTTGTMTVSHWGDAAWRRPDGRVMAVGGCALTGCPTSFVNTACGQVLANTDVWDPASHTWTSGAAMLTARTTFAGVPLGSGDMIVAGGCTTTSCTQMTDAGFCLASPCTQTTNLSEIYSVTKGTWLDAGTVSSPRFASMGVPIGSADALVVGGCDGVATDGGTGSCTTSVERWSAAASTWSEQAPLPAPRGFGTATVLADGRVFVVGGCADPVCATVLNDAVVYDPVANSWTAAGSMSSPRAGHSATLLGDGSVLVAGGCIDATCSATDAGSTVLSTADLWTPSGAADGGTAAGDGGAGDGGVAGQFTPAPSMAGARHHHTATRLANGDVLMAGGADATGSSVPTSEVYLPLAHQWIATSAMLMSRAFHIGVTLNDGRVLVSGGCNPQTCIPFAEIFSPARLPADSDAGVDAGEVTEDSGASATIDAGPAPAPTSPHPALYRTGVVTCATDTTQDLQCTDPQVAEWQLQDGVFQPNAQSLAKTASDEVTDKTTGLVWQLGDDGNTYTQPQAVAHCASFTSKAAATGWRLPSVIELMTLIDSGLGISANPPLPSIDPSFSGAQPTNYWTATPTASASMLAWTVKFDFGEVIPLLLDSALPVKCVRGKSDVLNVGGVGLRKAGPLKQLTDTVQDSTTKLEWQRADDGTRRTWQGSLDYCAHLSLGGKSGWHLPNVSELTSLVQYDALNSQGVAIDPAFDSAKADLYWTATQNEGIPLLSWTVTFNLGVVDGISVSGLGYARCVRHLESPAPSGSSCGCEVPGGAAGRATAALFASALAAFGMMLRRRPRARKATQ